MNSGTWAGRLADFLISAYASRIPDEVLERAALQMLDSVACAAGAHGSGPVRIAVESIAEVKGGEATVWFEKRSATVGDAVLANGTAVRYLDANDVFLGVGPGGHPSDNIPVAVAAAERFGSSGRDLLAAIAIAYELIYRLRTHVYRQTPLGPQWHEVSISGLVASVITALLGNANPSQLTEAIRIGASRGYTLREVRRGRISMLKASANAIVARDGVMSGLLALNGMTGPEKIFEGKDGLVETFGGTPDEAMIDALCAPPTWSILRVSIKPYPAFGTSQAAIMAAVACAGRIAAQDVIQRVEVRLRDSPWTHDYMSLEERRHPQTRETADHSLHFLVAIALIDGEVGERHYEDRCWERSDVQDLMSKIEIVPDPALGRSGSSFPAEVVVGVDRGDSVSEKVDRVPGSPEDPWGAPEVTSKFQRIDQVGLSRARMGEIAAEALALVSARNVLRFTSLIK